MASKAFLSRRRDPADFPAVQTPCQSGANLRSFVGAPSSRISANLGWSQPSVNKRLAFWDAAGRPENTSGSGAPLARPVHLRFAEHVANSLKPDIVIGIAPTAAERRADLPARRSVIPGDSRGPQRSRLFRPRHHGQRSRSKTGG